MDPELPIYNARTMSERMRLSLTLRAAYSWMLTVFAGIALLLALGGSCGVTSYLVSQRRRELGVRVALGARSRDISGAVLKGSITIVGIGVAIGITAAMGAGRWLSALLFGVPRYDALILSIAVAALCASGFLANWLPARRASRVDPMVSLRADWADPPEIEQVRRAGPGHADSRLDTVRMRLSLESAHTCSGGLEEAS